MIFKKLFFRHCSPPTSSESESEESSGDDDYIDNRPCHAQDSLSSKHSDRKQRVAFLFAIHSIINGKVHIETEGRHRSLTAMDGEPVIIINPSLVSSWFDTPKPIGPDTIGYWPPLTKYPGASECHIVPGDFKTHIPLKFAYHVPSEDLKTYLSAPRLTEKNGSIRVNPVVFEHASFPLSKSNICPVVDKFLRDQLTNNLITDEYINITDNLVKIATNIPKANPNVDNKFIVELLLEKLALIRKSVLLLAASNLRGRHNILAGIVRNKLVLREEVLAAHKVGGGFCSH